MKRFEEALQRVLDRVRTTLRPGLPGFPISADPATGVWTTTSDGSWTAGYGPGLLWLVARSSRRASDRELAASWTARLSARASTDTVFRGMLFWYGAALGHQLTQAPSARDIALAGARALVSSYDPRARLMPVGRALGGNADRSSIETTIDGVAGSVALLGWASRCTGDPSFRNIADEHARRHIELCVRADGSVCPAASLDPDNGAVLARYTQYGLHDASTWSRGQAWAMLAYAHAARWLSPNYADTAVRLADTWLARTGLQPVAPWDFDDPDGSRAVRDTSASAIAAAALLKLAVLVPQRSTLYRHAAVATLLELVTQHMTPLSPEESRPAGMLIHGCHRYRSDHARNRELIWGNYFLAEALLTVCELVDATLV